MHLRPCQTSRMEFFAKIGNGKKPLPIFANTSIIDVRAFATIKKLGLFFSHTYHSASNKCHENFFGNCKVINWPKPLLHWAKNEEFTFQHSIKSVTMKIQWCGYYHLMLWTRTLLWQINTLSANPTKWSNTFKQFVGCCCQIVWVCLIILWGWRWKGKDILFKFQKRDFY